MIESARLLGWDGVRFDGHWAVRESVPLSVRNARRMKERIWKQLPDFGFGFNYGYTPSSPQYRIFKGAWDLQMALPEIRENMAGGGYYMQEAIRKNVAAPGYLYQRWTEFGDMEGETVEMLRRMGGSYHPILENTNRQILALEQALVVSAGGHPAYGTHYEASGIGCPSWGRYFLRWSSLLWDYAIRQMDPEEAGVRVEAVPHLYWKKRVYERIEDEHTRQVILHFINLPPEDKLSEVVKKPKAATLELNAKDEGRSLEIKPPEEEENPDLVFTEETEERSGGGGAESGHENPRAVSLPLPPVKDVRVAVRIPAGQRPSHLYLVEPHRDTDAATEIAYEQKDNEVHFGLAEVPFWSTVVLELEGVFQRPARVSRFSDPPDEAKIQDEEKKLASYVRDTLIAWGPVEMDDRPPKEPPRTWAFDLGTTPRRRVGKVIEDKKSPGGQVEESSQEGLVSEIEKANLPYPGKYRATFYFLAEPAHAEEVGLEVEITDAPIDDEQEPFKALAGRISGPDLKHTDEYGKHEFLFVHRSSQWVSMKVSRAGERTVRSGPIVLELLEIFNEAKLSVYRNGPTRPSELAAWIPGAHGVKEVLALAGYFYPQYRLPDVAMAVDGRVEFTERMPPTVEEKKAVLEPKGPPALELVPNEANASQPDDLMAGDEDEIESVAAEEKKQADEKSRYTRMMEEKASRTRVHFLLSAFPPREMSYENVLRHDVVILANVHSDWLGYEGRKILYDFVQAGGKLVALGGGQAFGPGGYNETFLEELLPVQIEDGYDIVKLDPPGELLLTPGGESGEVHYLHRCPPKEGAEVKVSVETRAHGALPILVSWRFGKGEVAAFLGTVWGEAQTAGKVSFWDGKGWPEFGAKVILQRR